MDIKKKNIIVLLVLLIPALMVASAVDEAPEKPINLTAHPDKENFWVNFTWETGANTDSFNVSINDTVNRTWNNGSSNTSINVKSFPHGLVRIQIAGYNAISHEISGFIPGYGQIPNNPIIITNVSDTYYLNEGQTLYIDADYTDHDGDTGVFTTTSPKGELNPSTGVFIWTSAAGDQGTYNWQINVTDGKGSFKPWPFTAYVNPNIPKAPILSNVYPDKTNFWVNYSWTGDVNTDSFNLSVNGSWTNGTKDAFVNTKSSPHGWVNISVAGYNATSHILSTFASKNTQIPNNPIQITPLKEEKYYLNEGQTLYIDADYTDADGDKGTFATTAAKGTFDNSTGIISWTPIQGEGGIYHWSIRAADGYGPESFQDFTVIVRMNYGTKFIEPSVINDNGIWTETWREASIGHKGKFIGIDGIFNNTGEESLTFTVTDNPAKYCPEPCSFTLSPGRSKTFMQAFWGRRDFEINSSDINPSGFLNYTLNISVIGYIGQDQTFKYENSTTISLPTIPIFRMKYADGGIAGVAEGATTTITYTLEANSSVNWTNVSIYDPFYPVDQKGPYFNISKLQFDKSKNSCLDNSTIVDCKRIFTYKVTPDNLPKFKCLGGYQCIINMAVFNGTTESGLTINDTDFVRIFTEKLTPVQDSRSGGKSVSSGGGGGGMPSGEDFNNVEKREVREMSTLAGLASTYIFKYADPIAAVSFESSVSENEVPVAVEVLKNRSKKIGIDAPGDCINISMSMLE